MPDRTDHESSSRKNLRWLNLGMMLLFIFAAALPLMLNYFDRTPGRIAYGIFVSLFILFCFALGRFL